MNKKNKMVFCTSMLITTIIFAGCQNAGEKDKAGNQTEGIVKTKAADNDVRSSNMSQESIQSPDRVIAKIKEGQKAEMGEDILYEGCILKVQNIEITKEIGSRDKAQFDYWGEKTDEAGNLAGAESYIFVSLICRNDTEQSKELLLNSNRFVYADDDGILQETATEARFIDKPQKNNNDPVKLFHYVLKAGETSQQIEIGFIVEDSILDQGEGFYYCIGYQGSSIDSKNNRYIEASGGKK